MTIKLETYQTYDLQEFKNRKTIWKRWIKRGAYYQGLRLTEFHHHRGCHIHKRNLFLTWLNKKHYGVLRHEYQLYVSRTTEGTFCKLHENQLFVHHSVVSNLKNNKIKTK